jgi:hypothetical protein
MGPFLLDQVFEDAHVFGLQDLDRERVVWQVTVNETVEAEKLRVGRLRAFQRVIVFEAVGPFLLDP